jgi:osmoprotectant transport system permease protein
VPVSPAARGVRSAVVAAGCLQRNDWVCGAYLSTRADTILDATVQHVALTVVSVAIGLVLALPLGVLAFRSPRARSLVLGTATALYTIPSLAMFSLLLPVTGLTATTVVVGLVLYSLTILVRNVLAGLVAVPREVVESARGMGYSPTSLLLRVQLPLALPTLFAGLRVATVSTVALATVGAILGNGGLGNLIYSGLRTQFQAEVLTATVLVVALAVLADVLLLGVQRAVTPWQRGVR